MCKNNDSPLQKEIGLLLPLLCKKKQIIWHHVCHTFIMLLLLQNWLCSTEHGVVTPPPVTALTVVSRSGWKLLFFHSLQMNWKFQSRVCWEEAETCWLTWEQWLWENASTVVSLTKLNYPPCSGQRRLRLAVQRAAADGVLLSHLHK